MNLLMFAKAAYTLYKELKAQKKYIAQIVEPYIASVEKKYNGTLTKYQKHKITQSYCLFVPVIVCQSFNHLTQEPFTSEQRHAATMMGLITPLYDDLLDELNLTPAQIQQLTNHPEQYQSDEFLVNMVKEIGLHLIETAQDIPAYLKASADVLQIQIDTLKQFQRDTSSDEMQKITWDKAMLSFVYYYTHLHGHPSPEMKEALYEIAGLQQFCNDLFDMYKDCQGNNYTLANTCQDFTAMKSFFLEKNKQLFDKVLALPYPKKDKEVFMLRMLFIISSGLVAIDHMIQIEKKMGPNVNWFTVQRKDLILDFEKPTYLALWFFNFLKLMKLYRQYHH